MAGSMRKMAVYLGLVEDDRYDAYDDDDGYAERRDAYDRRGERAVDAGRDDGGYYDRADRRPERALDWPTNRHRDLDRDLDRDLNRDLDRPGERSVTMLREEPQRVRPRVAAGGEDLAAVTPMPALSERRSSGSTAMSVGAGPLIDRAGYNGSAGHGPAAPGMGLAAPAAPAQPAGPGGDVSSITTIHPRTYNEAKAIGERFREGTPVIMNLTEMDDRDAKRLVDFAAGLVFGLHGTIERVTSKVFLLSPVNVTVTAEDKARMAEGKFFNQS